MLVVSLTVVWDGRVVEVEVAEGAISKKFELLSNLNFCVK